MRVAVLSLVCGIVLPDLAQAQGKVAIAREAAEYVLQRFGKEAAKDGVEGLTRKIELLALKHGDEAVVAVRKVGPGTFRLVEEAGEHGLDAVKIMAKYGDDAVWVVAKKNRMAIFVKYGDDAAASMMKHGEIAEPLLRTFGQPAATALKSVSSQNARRLAMMSEDGQLASIGRTPELLAVIGKYGDPAADFIWRNRQLLLTSTPALAAFLASPEPFLNGETDVTTIRAEEASNSADSGTWQSSSWPAWILIGCVAATILLDGTMRIRSFRPIPSRLSEGP